MKIPIEIRRPSFALAACLFLALLWGGCARAPDEPLPAPRPQVALIAVDGLEPSVVARLFAARQLPHLRRLVERGVSATIDPVTASISPVVWTTVATGVSPERHGITDFTKDGVPVTSGMRTFPGFWNVLPRYGIDTAVLGWLVTWPAESNSGIVVSDRAYWGDFEDKIQPPELLDLSQYHYNGIADVDFLSRFTHYPYNPNYTALPVSDSSYAANFLIHRRLVNAYVHDSTYHRMTVDLLAKRRSDLVAVYFQGPDYVGHGFWKYYEPESFRKAGWEVDQQEVELLGQVIPSYYSYIDKLVGDLVSQLDEDALIILLSDHGFGPGLGPYAVEGGDYLSGNHRPDGVLILSGPQIRPQANWQAQVTHLDILPTIAFALGLPLSRQLEGHPLFGAFTDTFLAERELTFVDEYASDMMSSPSDGQGSTADEEILQELRSLGYLQ